jgi:hypothetical protein
MLPFEDPYTRQRRVAGVGRDGQDRIAGSRASVVAGPSALTEAAYLIRAGVGATSIEVSEEPRDFKHASAFSSAPSRDFAQGAWGALAHLRTAVTNTASTDSRSPA